MTFKQSEKSFTAWNPVNPQLQKYSSLLWKFILQWNTKNFNFNILLKWANWKQYFDMIAFWLLFMLSLLKALQSEVSHSDLIFFLIQGWSNGRDSPLSQKFENIIFTAPGSVFSLFSLRFHAALFQWIQLIFIGVTWKFVWANNEQLPLAAFSISLKCKLMMSIKS